MARRSSPAAAVSVINAVIDLEHAVATRVGGKTLLGSALSKLRSKAQQSASLAAAGAAVVVRPAAGNEGA